MVHSGELAILILDAGWRAVARLPASGDWRALMRVLLASNSRWIALEQSRQSGAVLWPDAADIVLTRSLCRRLRPMDMMLADHVIRAPEGHFSFRAAGLL